VRRRPVLWFAAAVVAQTGLLGCARTVQAWPPPLPIGSAVTIHRTGARQMVVENNAGRDSVVTLAELEGRVASLRGDTLVIRVTRAPAAGTDWIVGQRARLVLDSSTIVTRSEVDSWKVGYSILAGAVLIFAGLVLSGS
jgi:hypothetical protein